MTHLFQSRHLYRPVYLTLWPASENQGTCNVAVVIQSLSRVRLFSTPWTTACQASSSFIFSQSLLKLMSTETVMPSNHLILCLPLLLLPSVFPSIRVFPVNQFFTSGGQSVGASASASVLPVNIQGWLQLNKHVAWIKIYVCVCVCVCMQFFRLPRWH